MRKIFISRIYTALYLVMFIGIVAACKEDEVAGSSEVKLLSFGPSGVKPGEKISFIGNNLNKVTSIELKGASVPSSAFVTHTSELIVITVPQETDEGPVTLKTPEGDVTSKTVLSFEVPVKISGFTAAARPGENITITGEYLNWIKEIRFAKDTAVTEFVSQSVSQLVVTVPFGAETGPLVISTGGTEPLTIETETKLVVALPALSSLSPNPAEREKNLTIRGTNLDLVKGISFKGLAQPVTQFVSKTASELVVVVPKVANKGKVTLVAFSGIMIESEESLKFVGDLPDLAPLKYAMYEDALQNGWQNWGWGSTVDFGNSENIRDGEASAKITYTGSWGALKFANVSLATAPYTEVTFSIYGAAGTEGKTVNVMANGGKAYVVTIKEGEWTEYKVPLTAFGSPVTLTDLMFQETGWPGTLYIDHVGLR
ncbi:hypothetical protein DYBT9275_04116 [Dyadobacter sp. CECT 9275]|uniref:IPT/TIG domain-containing protein n=1 Tax=Dyadobacter helix TaxID=2822344 RepID=A0A916JF82_9BACT|nr:hypothetical protein [Dyadobacter sp. CECT 9275]CAG5007742.1 hypothetical protein DYBT9275_04116 [Dyadobacter sp. CECT 9275]